MKKKVSVGSRLFSISRLSDFVQTWDLWACAHLLSWKLLFIYFFFFTLTPWKLPDASQKAGVPLLRTGLRRAEV